MDGQDQPRVLIVEDDELDRELLRQMTESWGFAVATAADGIEAVEQLEQFHPHVIVTDLVMPRMDGFELLRKLQTMDTAPPSIALTGFGGLEKAVSTIHDLGAFWFLEKPVSDAALRVLLDRAASQSRLAIENQALRLQLSYQGVMLDMVGESAPMQELFSMIRLVAPNKAPVLITGESGTGKELVARAIHSLSGRSKGPFVAINCAALPETLIESELFGHEKGAFTGALERRAGAIERAHGGTLLMDELGEMPVGTQAKLLRVLEDSVVQRLGGRGDTQVDVRYLAATNRDPLQSIRDSKLREDLYYRLNVFHLQLPPLRERREDLAVLCSALIQSLNRRHECRVAGVDAEVMELFQQYHWPGNVRELRNALERAVILARDELVRVRHLPPPFHSRPKPKPSSEEPGVVKLAVGTSVGEAEEALIRLTLEHTRNNKTRAAEILGISTRTLHVKLKEYATREQKAAGTG
ncbi:MAG: sigma-54-dependent Fis family transcriptional regulator [Bryobacteraceae bacterium]|nr:sigma-54-dependent Fis family transcriptional regulator [Bryobacteraceae bacterium]